jgi:hypothetical protein
LIEPLFYQYNPRFKGAGTVFSPHTAIMSLEKGENPCLENKVCYILYNFDTLTANINKGALWNSKKQ